MVAGAINNTTPIVNTAHNKTAIILLNLLPDVIISPPRVCIIRSVNNLLTPKLYNPYKKIQEKRQICSIFDKSANAVYYCIRGF